MSKGDEGRDTERESQPSLKMYFLIILMYSRYIQRDTNQEDTLKKINARRYIQKDTICFEFRQAKYL